MAQSIITPTRLQELELRTEVSLQAARSLINRSYLAEMKLYPLQDLASQTGLAVNRATDIRIFRIERIVQENKKSVLESTTAAYTALGAAGYTVFLFLKSDGRETHLYIGTRGTAGKTLGHSAGELLKETFKGHFSGSHLIPLAATETDELLDGALAQQHEPSASITAVTGVPSLSTDNHDLFMQGLEHFIDAAESRVYQALILAEPISPQNLEVIRTGYEQVATQLSGLVKRNYSYGAQDSESIGLSISEGLSQSLGESLGMTETKGTSDTTGTSTSSSWGNTYTSGASNAFTRTVDEFQRSYQQGDTMGPMRSLGCLLKHNVLERNISASQTSGGSAGVSSSQTATQSHANSTTTTQTDTTTRTDSHSLNKTQGNTRQIAFDITDKTVEKLLEKVDHHLERVNEAHTYGGWQTAAYFIGDSTASSESLASIFLGLMRGSRSSTEDFALTTWQSREKKMVLEWLTTLTHPHLTPMFSAGINIDFLTPATLVSSKEMAIQLSLPRRSTSTVAVLQTQAFGRKVQRLDSNNATEKRERQICLGQIRHLWNDLPQTINLDVNQLASHLFVTGSTGAGKSNTIYELLSQLGQHGIPFLVIEPAKGEYKHIFGHHPDVRVLGSNTRYSELLRINPFRFPPETHVLEHIDRLVEVFSMCWPMYAAMPAILKEAILQSYSECGWNMVDSINQFSPALFPTFNDLLAQLQAVIDDSAYSQELKSNYTGSLVTRVKSLTNGLNGQIFCGEEIDSMELFDRKVIIDLSRIGAQETKSLIMGILVIRLSEYRAANSGMNQPLKHVTVLEEAHNILKRGNTSGGEGNDITGKSVEMLANAIAEMRTWGEGFIIADQSPYAVDISAIRNTNTKIIMRLPDEADRRIAGKSAGLNDEQLDELARFPKGVALVYQNDWLEPVLCRVNKFAGKEVLYHYDAPTSMATNAQQFNQHLLNWLLSPRVPVPQVISLETLEAELDGSNLATTQKIQLKSLFSAFRETGMLGLHQEQNFARLANIVVNLFGYSSAIERCVRQASGFDVLDTTFRRLITRQAGELPESLNVAIQQCFMRDLVTRSEEFLPVYAEWRDYITSEAVA
ncbi:ATP-binding protein [Pectobacterium brasiliense]|uniref:ATP-binding protein n=1 Tax=Pectobacterium brasiliense TaxID=180957 RepID=UPI0015DF5F5A|nr:ATP-binding protein [Pectobacterium brasiliense]MBA0217821.1 ATP-binding protein [Pectobacterium brasiliense]MBN3073861.1 ATP-binding protein [Pectobacterium brasiliense]MBN3169284.1 ATP-binding protein [Pectobacterium brasiliense]